MERNTLLMLRERAARIRMLSVEAIYGAKSGHPGGSLSIAEIIAYLYFDKMKVDPKNPGPRKGQVRSLQRALLPGALRGSRDARIFR